MGILDQTQYIVDPIEIGPDPSALIESLRAFGYSLESAIADIIDNSIFALADKIWLTFFWDGEKSSISIKDNGTGMSEKTLINAMRLGSQSPQDDRDSRDLGRFGLGLKTASISHCREFTVASKTAGNSIFIRCWNLDHINKTKKWQLLIKDDNYHNGLFRELNVLESGTIVLWENLDRLVKNTSTTNKKQEDNFYENIDRVKIHLSMIFHRFLSGHKPIKIFINNRPLEPWNPFLINHPATQQLPVEHMVYNGQKIILKPYILPHRSKLSDSQFENAGGPGGWNSRQGFYIYRNNRLIVPGDWLGLGFRKESITKLVRIQVDIPNTLDDNWKIDVKKSVAKPPAELKERFKKIADATIERGILVYRHRGKIIERENGGDLIFTWNSSIRNGICHYEINRVHPIIDDILTKSGVLKDEVQAMLHLIEETIPIQLILMNAMKDVDKQPKAFEDTPSDEIKSLLTLVYNLMSKNGRSEEEIFMKLYNIEPFCDYPKFVTEFIKTRKL